VRPPGGVPARCMRKADVGRFWMSRALRWWVVGIALLAEYLCISFRFDARTVSRRGGVWEVVGSLGGVAPLAVVAATAMLVLRTPRSDAVVAAPRPVRPWMFGVHGLLLAAFWAITSMVFGAREAPPGPPHVWLALWVGVATASALTLAVGMLGAGEIRAVVSASLLVPVGLGFAAWSAGSFVTFFWAPFARATFRVVAALLRLGFDNVVEVPGESVIALEGFAVRVAPVCSGLEGIGLVTVLLLGLIVGFRQRFRFPHVLLLLPLGVLAAWAGNVVRVTLLLVIGARWDPRIALGGFHSKAGWVFFCAVALGLATFARRARYLAREPSRADSLDENPTAAFLMPVLATISASLVSGMFASGEMDRFYWLRIIAATAMLVAYRRYYRTLERAVHAGSVVLGALVGVLWVASNRAPGGAAESATTLWTVSRVVGSVAVAPLCEELAFRGYALRRLVNPDFTRVSFREWTPLAVLGSSAAFAMMHERYVAAFLAGLAYAFVQIRTGRLSDVIVAHAASNAVICIWVLVTGERGHW